MQQTCGPPHLDATAISRAGLINFFEFPASCLQDDVCDHWVLLSGASAYANRSGDVPSMGNWNTAGQDHILAPTRIADAEQVGARLCHRDDGRRWCMDRSRHLSFAGRKVERAGPHAIHTRHRDQFSALIENDHRRSYAHLRSLLRRRDSSSCGVERNMLQIHSFLPMMFCDGAPDVRR